MNMWYYLKSVLNQLAKMQWQAEHFRPGVLPELTHLLIRPYDVAGIETINDGTETQYK